MSSARSRLLTVLLAALLLIVGSTIGAYAASGHPFLLGHGNKATKTTKLKSTGSGAALSIKNTGTGGALDLSSKGSGAALSVTNSGGGGALGLTSNGSGAALSASNAGSGSALDLTTTGSGAPLNLTSAPGTPPFKVSNSTKVGGLNADLLDGLDSAALQGQSYVYNLDATVGAGFRHAVFTFPTLPPGHYLVNYSVTAATTAATNKIACLFVDTFPSLNQFDISVGNTNGGGLQWFVNGGGYLDTSAASRELVCQVNDTNGFSIPEGTDDLSTVTFTRLDAITNASSTGTGQ